MPVSLTIAGQPAGGNYALNAYDAPATWTKPVGLKAVKVTVVGGGGTGGSSTSTAPASASGGGGGGGGGATIDYIPAPSIPGPVAVTAGAGTNSFGAFCSATAGANGGNSTPSVTGGGGAGGTGSDGQINLTGTSGFAGSGLGTGFPSMGGTSQLFANQRFFNLTPNVNGIPNPFIGGGGTGSGSSQAGNPARTGGTGGPGIVIVEEFY
jgi:hypothetical protein